MNILNRTIGSGSPAFIIAEMSGNHNQSLESALDIVRAAAQAGADAIKIQTYTADTMTLDLKEREFFISDDQSLWSGTSLYDLYKVAYTPWEWHEPIARLADELGLIFFSTPFDKSAVDFLEEMDVPAFKIASFELVDHPLIEYIAMTGKPIILSTGMATEEEIREALNLIIGTGNRSVVILKCTSAYPAPALDMNLKTIPDMIEKFNVPVGLSDHTLGWVAPVSAVSLGASVIEKHLTLSRSLPGPDSKFSIEPDEFRDMIDAIRIAEQALGTVKYGPQEHEQNNLVFRRSLYVVKDIHCGEIFTEENVRSIRPGKGIPPKYLKKVIGSRSLSDLKKGTPLQWNMIG